MVQRGAVLSDVEYERWRCGNIRVVNRWATDGLLEDINPDKAQKIVEEGAMVFTCSDRKQVVKDIIPHLRDWFLTDELHTFGCHGAAAMLDPSFPYNRLQRDVSGFWLDEAEEAFGMGVNHALLVGHVPCRRMWRYRFSAVQMVRSMIVGKDRLEELIPGLTVGLLIQVDRGPQCTDRKQRVTRLFHASNFRDIVGVPRPDHVPVSTP